MFAWFVGLLVLGIWWCFGGVSVLFWSRVGRDSLVYWWCGVDVLLFFGGFCLWACWVLWCRVALGLVEFGLCVRGVLVVRSWCESDSWHLSQATWCIQTPPKYHHNFTNTPPNHDLWLNVGGVLVVLCWVGIIL